eukprot:6492178-Amphidinium_carterae.2
MSSCSVRNNSRAQKCKGLPCTISPIVDMRMSSHCTSFLSAFVDQVPRPDSRATNLKDAKRQLPGVVGE